MPVYFIETPEGKRVPLGSFKTRVAAKAAMTRKLNADFRALCIGPFEDTENYCPHGVPRKSDTIKWTYLDCQKED